MRLNVGSEPGYLDGFTNVSTNTLVKNDQVIQPDKTPWPWQENSVTELRLVHLLEQISAADNRYTEVIQEIYRICQNQATVTVVSHHPRSDGFIDDPRNVRPIMRAGLEMFDQRLNREWQKARAANTPLGIYLGVDFEITHVAYDLAEPWRTDLAQDRIGWPEVYDAERKFNNVVNRTIVTLKVHKPTRLAASTSDEREQERALTNQIIEAFGKKEFASAKALCDEFLARNDKRPDVWTLKGTIMRRLGDIPAAIAAYQHALTIQDDYVDAHFNMGNALRANDQQAEAAKAYQAAIALRDNWKEPHCYLCDTLRVLGQLDQALEACKTAIAIDAKYAEGHNNIANVYREMKAFDKAQEHYRIAVTLEPTYADAWYNLGILHHDLQQHEAAIACYEEALKYKPNESKTYYNMGISKQGIGDLDAARHYYEKAIALDPSYSTAYFNLGCVHNLKGQMKAAADAFEIALEKGRGEQPSTRVNLFHARQHLCEWDRFDALREEVLEPALAWDSKGLSPSPFPFLSMPVTISAEEHLRLARHHARSIEAQVVEPFTHGAPQDKKRLKVGYVSADFHNHATAHLMLGLFARHDRDQFEIYCYSAGPEDDSSYRRRIRSDSDYFVDISRLNAAEAARLMHEDGIDILIDLKGYTRDSDPLIFAYRPAPIQVTWIGYPGPLGADFIDYVLTDKVVTPPPMQEWYTERFVYLPNCYQVNDSEQAIADDKPTRAECGLPDEGFVFCCFNTPYKIEPMIFGHWMEILKAVPGSVLWLIGGSDRSRSNLIKEAEARGVDGERLIFASRMPKDQHLARHRLADLFLDSFYYNAHTTASDALWAGLPVLTCPGEHFASRVGASLLEAVGMPELIMATFEDYKAEAIRLARKPKALTAIRKKLADKRLTTPLYDTDRFARNLDHALQLMWRRWREGDLETIIDVEAETR